MTPEVPHLKALLEQRTWVQDLARRLVRDPAAAEDVAQEAMLAALKSPREPRPEDANATRTLRGWLASVVRNQVFERMRREDRRATRERRVARGEEAPSTLDLVSEVSAHKDLVEVLMELPEHYRDVLVRRYYEGETPTEIAAAQGTPVTTVKTRLQRGLALLRERLDERHGGDGRAWLAALAPLVGRGLPTPPAASASSSSAASVAAPLGPTAARLVLGAALIAVVPALVWLLRGAWGGAERDGGLDAAALLGAAEADAPAADRALSAPDGELARNASTSDPDLVFETRRAAALATLTHVHGDVTGRVVDLSGRGISGALVRFDVDRWFASRGVGSPVAVTDPDGAFQLRGVGRTGLIRAAIDGMVTVSAGRVGAESFGAEVAIVVAPVAMLEGVVVDADGAGLGAAWVEVVPPAGGLVEGRGSAPLAFEVETASDGRFELRAPSLAGARLRVSRDGFATANVELDGADGAGRTIALERITPASGLRIEGVVRGPNGAPIADARVAGGGRIVTTTADGTFALAADGVDELTAFAPDAGSGLGAARYAPPTRSDEPGEPAWPERVELVLEPAPRALAGRVVDRRGAPLAGVRVWIDDPTVLASADARSGAGDPDVELVGARAAEIGRAGLPTVLEARLAREATRVWRFVTTDSDGAFTLDGLGPRAYRVAALDPYTLALARSAPAEAGASDVELVLDVGDLAPARAGRVVDRTGAPIAGVRVSVQRRTLALSRDGETVWSEATLRGCGQTRGDGTFELEDLARGDASLRLEADAIVPTVIPLEHDGTELELTVVRRARVRLVGAPPGSTAVLYDGGGAVVPALHVSGARRTRMTEIALEDGASAVLVVPDTATEVEVRAPGEEPRRVPLTLRGDGVLEIRL